jgi:uncharacterized protein (DUF2384 family)
LGRPKGSTNKKKANGSAAPAEDRSITHHDNLSRDPLTDEQLEALTNSHVNIIERLEAADKLAHNALMNAYKVAKADGILKKDIEVYRNAKTEEGQEKIRLEAARIARAARWFKFATQSDLFDSPESPAPVGNKSYRLGKEAGLNGEPAKPPETADQETWMQGWHAGQTQMASLGIKQAESAASGDDVDF